MPFESGNKFSKGRKLGSLNRRTSELISLLDESGFDPAVELITCYEEAKTAWKKMPFEEGSPYLKIAVEIAKHLALFAYPRIKAVEQIRGNILDGMSHKEKLEAMKQAVALMESQAKEDESQNP